MVQCSKRSLHLLHAEEMQTQTHAYRRSVQQWLGKTPIGSPAYVALT